MLQTPHATRHADYMELPRPPPKKYPVHTRSPHTTTHTTSEHRGTAVANDKNALPSFIQNSENYHQQVLSFYVWGKEHTVLSIKVAVFTEERSYWGQFFFFFCFNAKAKNEKKKGQAIFKQFFVVFVYYQYARLFSRYSSIDF